MPFDTIIRGGTIHTAERSFPGDVAIAGERIAALAAPETLPADARTRVIDARGMDVLPGAIDVHVHLALPFCGTVSCDDFESGSRAAVAGGVTTVLDFAIPARGQSLAEAHAAWLDKSRGRSIVDHAWHLAITDRAHLGEVPGMAAQGLPTFKQFMIYEAEGWNADDAMIYEGLELARDHNAMLLLHAESPRLLDLLVSRCRTSELMARHGARLHAMSRPNLIEAEAVERAIRWSEATRGPLYIVHMSTAEGADLVRAAQARGVPVLAETCAQYLVLDDSVFDSPDGHLFACCPQVKKPADRERLWRAIRSAREGGGEVCVVSTDTCSFTRAQKAMWEGDFTKIPMGLPGLETLVPTLYTLGVRAGRISINRLVDLCCTTPARVMGLGDRKGAIAPGLDADLAIIDPARTVPVDWSTMHSRCDWSPYQGLRLGGFARTTLIRGTPVFEDGKVTGTPGSGRFLPRRLGASLNPR